jgi:hypothetical protein
LISFNLDEEFSIFPFVPLLLVLPSGRREKRRPKHLFRPAVFPANAGATRPFVFELDLDMLDVTAAVSL